MLLCHVAKIDQGDFDLFSQIALQQYTVNRNSVAD